MLKYLLCFSALLLSVYGNGEFSVLTHPPSAAFKGHDHLKESLLEEVYSAVLGFTTQQDSNWQGLYLLDPFDLAKGVVTFSVEGVTDIGQSKGHHYPLKTDKDEREVFEEMSKRIEERHPNSDERNVYRIDLSKGIESVKDIEAFSGIKKLKIEKPSVLKLSFEEDKSFLEELSLLDSICEKVDMIVFSDEETPSIFWFRFGGLHAVSDLHGENSTATKEAKRLLVSTIERCNSAFEKLYAGKVLVNVVTSDASHTRRVRRAAEATDDLNLAKNYTSDYPVIFNIILWFGVIMLFTLLAICLFIAGMDPGRDSIIYRMTSTRMKKDN